MVENIEIRTQLQSLESLIQLNKLVRSKLKDIEAQFPVQVGAAQAARAYIHKTALYGDSQGRTLPQEYSRIMKTEGHSKSPEEHQAFKLALKSLKLLERFASKRQRPEEIPGLVNEAARILHHA